MTVPQTRPLPVVENGDGETHVPPPVTHAAPPPPPLPTRATSGGIWFWLVLLLLLVAGGWLGYWLWHTAAQKQATASRPGSGRGTPVVTVTAQLKDIPLYLDGVGNVMPLNTVQLHTRVDGQLVELHIEEGKDVKAGALLAVIDPRPYQVQLAQAQGQLAQAQGQLAQAVGQMAQAQGQLAKDQATVDNAQRDLDRYMKAAEAVSGQQVDTARTQVDQAKAAIAIDQAAIQGAQADKEVASAAIQVANAAIQNAQLMLTYTRITAPISGRIGLRNVDLGNLVHASDANGLATITQIQPITVVFTLAQDVLPRVQRAMRQDGEVAVLAYDSTFQTKLASGHLLALDNQIDVASGTFKTKAVFDNTDYALFPQQLVNVRLLAETRKNVVVVPSQAVQRSPLASYVDVIKDDNTVEQRTITPGPTEAGMTIIESGLKAGEAVATEGLDRLEDGTKVTILSPQTQRAGSGPATKPESAPASRGDRGTRPATAPATGG